MSLIIEGGRVPSHWAERRARGSVTAIDQHQKRDGINLALINNMPDPALEDTELQFFELLDIASGNTPVFIKLYSLVGVPRTERGDRHLNSFYHPFDDLWRHQFDGVIITGTEPHHPNLRDEPYWNLLAQVFDWAERSTNSTILSCLAAHASVLHGDGIQRHPLQDKRFGVFETTRGADHALINEIAEGIRFPHSRWNEVREEDLAPAGYTILTKSVDAGVDTFVKKKKNSLFVHFQGHPEYGAQTLMKEYRRDIRRFFRGERKTYPTMPHGYFDQDATQVLGAFRDMPSGHEELIDPLFDSLGKGLGNTWQSVAIAVYRNWLTYLESRKNEMPGFAAFAMTRPGRQRTVDSEIA